MQDSYAPSGTVEIAGARETVVHHDGEIAYVAASDGFAVVDISDPQSPTLLTEHREFDTESELGHSGQPMKLVWDVKASGDRLAVVGPANPASGSAQGVALFDISDPANPTQLDWHGTEFYIHNAFFDDGTVYLTGSGLRRNPLVLLDAEQDTLSELARWSIADQGEPWASLPFPSRPLHDIYVQDNIAYLAYWEAGAWLVDVSDPTDMVVLSRVGDFTEAEIAEFGIEKSLTQSRIPPGNAHYTTVNEDATLLAVGKEAWAATVDDELVGGPGGIDLYDITDPAAPERLATIDAPASFDQTRGGWFTTAHNCDFVGDRLYSSWYYGGVRVHDVSTPAAPEEIAWWRNPREASFWTAQGGAAGESFVASSANLKIDFGGMNATRDALYVFPDRPGTQTDPPDLTEPPQDLIETPTPTQTQNETAPSAETPTNTTTSAATSSPAATTSSDGGGPGFSAGTALVGLGSAAYALAQRYRAGNDGQ